MNKPFDKNLLLKLALNQLEDQRTLLMTSALEAKAASTHEEAKAENKYDTRGLEASYLAAGQSRRVKELEESIFILKKIKPKTFSKDDPIGLTAMVLLSFEDADKWIFLIPASGMAIQLDSTKVQTMSLSSPIGQLLLEAVVGDTIELNGREYDILDIQ